VESPVAKTSGKLVEKDRKGMKGLVLKLKQTIEGRPSAVPPPTARTDDSASPPVVAPPVVAPPTPSAATRPSATHSPTEEIVRPAPSGRRKSLSFYQSRYAEDREKAMVMAFRSGHYAIEDIAEHFGLQPGAIVKTVRQHQE
jgi:hypothetical protein